MDDWLQNFYEAYYVNDGIQQFIQLLLNLTEPITPELLLGKSIDDLQLEMDELRVELRDIYPNKDHVHHHWADAEFSGHIDVESDNKYARYEETIAADMITPTIVTWKDMANTCLKREVCLNKDGNLSYVCLTTNYNLSYIDIRFNFRKNVCCSIMSASYNTPDPCPNGPRVLFINGRINTIDYYDDDELVARIVSPEKRSFYFDSLQDDQGIVRLNTDTKIYAPLTKA